MHVVLGALAFSVTNPPDVDGDAIEQAVNHAIEQAVREGEGGLTIKWVAVIETCGPDGARGVWTFASPDVKAWDTIGLLGYGLELERADIHARRLDEE